MRDALAATAWAVALAAATPLLVSASPAGRRWRPAVGQPREASSWAQRCGAALAIAARALRAIGRRERSGGWAGGLTQSLSMAQGRRSIGPAPSSMNPLRTLETTLASLVEGAFGRVFRSEVRPMELARKLAREMDEHRTRRSRGCTRPTSTPSGCRPRIARAMRVSRTT